MTKRKRFDVKKILADPDLRRELMVPTIQATQAREGIETTREQADRAYYVVSEGEKAAFIDLTSFRQEEHTKYDLREDKLVQCLRGDIDRIRFDVARKDFGTVSGSPLAYQRIGIIAHLSKESPLLEPAWGVVRQGKATGDDERWLRNWWEVVSDTNWVPFAKGGGFSRFYFDVYLVIDWKPEHRDELKASGNGLPSFEHYFKPGLTWPRRTQKGFNVRKMPEGCIFADKGPTIFASKTDDENFLLGVTNCRIAEYILMGFMSFGSWEVGVVKRLPIPKPSATQKSDIGDMAHSIYEAKASWDHGNEICTHFQLPWLLRADILDSNNSIPVRLHQLSGFEKSEEARLRELHAQLNDEMYKLYGIPDKTRKDIDETLIDRPPEVLWPQMEGKSIEQKRMEHVWRLLSYTVKRVVDADEDGIVPYQAVAGKTALIDLIREELAALFPDHDVNKIEVEIINELKARVPGYRTVASIEQWIEDVYFEFHCSLYKNRPIIWHITSKQGRDTQAFGVLCHYHKFESNRMAKLRGSYLRDTIQTFKREAALAAQEGRTEDRQEWQTKLEEVQELDRKLQLVQEGFSEGKEGGDRDFRILTPWKSPNERPKGWNPDIDDGVVVNIAPLQRAGVLRKEKVV